MVKSGQIDKKVFSFSISPDYNNGTSAVTFGGYDLDKFATGNLTWHDVDKSSIWWTLYLTDMSISIDTYTGENDTFTRTPAFNGSYGQGAKVIVDSGTSYIYMP